MKMLSIIIRFKLIIFIWVSNYLIAADDDCGNNNNFTIRLTIDSRRNDSGHWISQVELLHSDKGEGSEKQWTVDVVQKTSKCNESNGEMTNSNSFVSLDATLFTPMAQRAAPVAAAQGEEESVLSLLELHGEMVAFSATPLPWTAARRVCRDGLKGGGDLVDLVDGAPAPLLAALLEAVDVDMAFVGVRRAPEAPHRFLTAAGDPVTPSDSLPWETGRPATKGPLAEDACISILKTRKLLDVDCDALLPFLCTPAL